MNGTLRTLALVALVAVGAFAGASAAASNGSLTASPSTPGETATHTATLTVGNDSTGSLNGFQIDYSEAGIDVSNVGNEDIATVGIDEGDDADGATVDQDVSDDLDTVTQSNNGETLTLGLGGSYDLAAGDEVVVAIEGVENPSAGDHQVSLDINPQSSGGEGSATLTITDSSSAETATPTADSTDAENGGENALDDTDETDSEDTENSDDDSTTTSGPGFGAGLTVLALLGAAFVAMRRDN